MKNDAFQSITCAKQLKALSDPLRLRIVDVLRHGELTVSDLVELLEVEMVTVSHHLSILKHAALVEARREGRFMYYQLGEDLMQQSQGKGPQFLNLGCCRIEIPDQPPSKQPPQ